MEPQNRNGGKLNGVGFVRSKGRQGVWGKGVCVNVCGRHGCARQRPVGQKEGVCVCGGPNQRNKPRRGAQCPEPEMKGTVSNANAAVAQGGIGTVCVQSHKCPHGVGPV